MKQKLLYGTLVVFVASAALLLGAWRTQIFLAHEKARSLAAYAGTTHIVEGRVVSDPERKDTSLRAIIEATKIDEQVVPNSGKLLATLPRDSQFLYGDTIVLLGEVVLPESFETDTGHMFDYPNYLRVRGISVLMRYATLASVEPGGFTLQGSLFAIKHAFEKSLEKLFVEPQGALMEGILLGEKRGLPQDLNNAFIISGLVHVVVLSGYNISIVAEWVMRAFAFLPQALGLLLGGLTIVLFALMTGGSATAVRACIMALIAILGRYLQRPSIALHSLMVAAAAMALWNPLSLLYDPSFILSVLATFGLITISPSVEQKLWRLTNRFGIRSIAASTIAVQIYVLPALLYFTGILSFVSLPANILALPVVSLAMLLGFVSGIFGLVHPLLALLPSIAADILLRWMIFIAHAATSVPFASTIVSAFPAWVALVCYVPLTVFAIFVYSKTAAR